MPGIDFVVLLVFLVKPPVVIVDDVILTRALRFTFFCWDLAGSMILGFPGLIVSLGFPKGELGCTSRLRPLLFIAF
jgi:hypothetical protein